MAGMMKKLTNSAECVFTGKGLSFGGSLIRPEGYRPRPALLRGGHAGPSRPVAGGHAGLGAGLGQRGPVRHREGDGPRRLVITASDSGGTVYDPDGFTPRSWPV